jgi:acetylornithine deacetylase/succinyl-diaminopimelate desuccinylase-like protein
VAFVDRDLLPLTSLLSTDGSGHAGAGLGVGLGLAAPRLNSPGSHDANNFAASGVPTGMILVRNRNGSHNPHEAMETNDLMAAVDTLAVMLGDGAAAGA